MPPERARSGDCTKVSVGAARYQSVMGGLQSWAQGPAHVTGRARIGFLVTVIDDDESVRESLPGAAGRAGLRDGGL